MILARTLQTKIINMESQNNIVFPQDEPPLYQHIGILAPHKRLVCAINVKQKTTTYFSDKQKGLNNLFGVFEKIRKDAFAKLRNWKKKDKGRTYEHFLPGDLLKGKDSIVPEYLQRLKNQRIFSYIKFRWTQNSSNARTVHSLINLLQKLVERRWTSFMQKLQLLRITPRKAKGSETLTDYVNMADTSGRSMSACFGRTQEKCSVKGANITLMKIRLTPENMKTASFIRQRVLSSRPQGISIRQLERSLESKRYKFESQDSRWQRVKVQHSIHRI